MNLFDKLVAEAIQNQPDFLILRTVVEKELLHHDILRIMSQNGLLKHLTFIGGTCLRSCYGSIRLSEDLDFTGGSDFTRDSLSTMGKILVQSLIDKYNLLVQVSEPIIDKHNVDTWKIKIDTRPKDKQLPAQRINIDICAIPSYESRPMMLLNPYGVDMGTSGLILQVQSREEIYADKIIAFALRANRIKYRDIWDIIWLHQQGFKPRIELIPKKLRDRKHGINDFLNVLNTRKKMLLESIDIQLEFKKEIHRFLPAKHIEQFIEKQELWSFLFYLLDDLQKQIQCLAL